jgi:hypothetical protein
MTIDPLAATPRCRRCICHQEEGEWFAPGVLCPNCACWHPGYVRVTFSPREDTPMSTNSIYRDDDPFGWWRPGEPASAEGAYHDILSASAATDRWPAD